MPFSLSRPFNFQHVHMFMFYVTSLLSRAFAMRARSAPPAGRDFSFPDNPWVHYGPFATYASHSVSFVL